MLSNNRMKHHDNRPKFNLLYIKRYSAQRILGKALPKMCNFVSSTLKTRIDQAYAV